jgi:hypothetical protein
VCFDCPLRTRPVAFFLNNQGYNIGIYQTATLMKQANVVAIRPRKTSKKAFHNCIVPTITPSAHALGNAFAFLILLEVFL